MKISTRTIVSIGMFTAVLSVLSIISIPMPSGVPITLQTFAVALCGYVLGWKKGTASTLLYILLGTIGVPVFAGMTGGPAWLVGYTGGFIWGFFFLDTVLRGWRKAKKYSDLRDIWSDWAGRLPRSWSNQFAAVASTDLGASFLTVSAPYIGKDVISIAGAYLVALPVKKALSAGNLFGEETHRVAGGKL